MVPVSSFPLLRLPKNATMNILRSMDPLELFGISLASKRTKALVQSVSIKPADFVLLFTDRLRIWLPFPREDINLMNFKTLPNLLEFSVNYEKEENRWCVNGMDGKKLLSHLITIFKSFIIRFLCEENSEQFDFEQILGGSQNIKAIELNDNFQENNRKILNIIKPSMARLGRLTARDILIQNFDYLDVRDRKFSLDDLLTTNSRNFDKNCPKVPTKQLNRFLKLWTRGSNPHLESLILRVQNINDFTEEIIFDRLEVTQNTTVRYFTSTRVRRKVTGGMNIFRCDGTMATICLPNRATVGYQFRMHVWHNHCVVEEST